MAHFKVAENIERKRQALAQRRQLQVSVKR